MPDHPPPPPADLVDTLPDDVPIPHEDARPAKVAKYGAPLPWLHGTWDSTGTVALAVLEAEGKTP